MEGEGAEGEAEGDVVEGVGFGGRGKLGGGDGDFHLLGHDVAIVEALGICVGSSIKTKYTGV